MIQENPQAVASLVEIGDRAGQAAQALEALAQAWLRGRNKKKSLQLKIFEDLPQALGDAILENYLIAHLGESHGLGHALTASREFLSRPRGKREVALKQGWTLELNSKEMKLKKRRGRSFNTKQASKPSPRPEKLF